jgi:hypothetical protein
MGSLLWLRSSNTRQKKSPAVLPAGQVSDVAQDTAGEQVSRTDATAGFQPRLRPIAPGLPLGDRKNRLARLVGKRRAGIVLSQHTDEDGTTIFRQACKMGLEGIVSKRLSAP